MVPNGVDGAWWRDGAEAGRDGAEAGRDGAAAGAEHRPVHVVSAMRLVSRKRPVATLRVLRGARAILDPAVPLRATIVGEGPQRRVMERYLRTREMDWVELPGSGRPRGLRSLHQSADAYLTTARLEAFGIAPLEARAAGLPVVAPRGTGVDDFVDDGVEGLLADTDVVLAGALAHLARDSALRARIRGHNLDVPPVQDWPGVVAATVREYRRAGVRTT